MLFWKVLNKQQKTHMEFELGIPIPISSQTTVMLPRNSLYSTLMYQTLFFYAKKIFYFYRQLSKIIDFPSASLELLWSSFVRVNKKKRKSTFSMTHSLQFYGCQNRKSMASKTNIIPLDFAIRKWIHSKHHFHPTKFVTSFVVFSLSAIPKRNTTRIFSLINT